MLVVSDTTPLRYLIYIGEVEVLPQLFGNVIIPKGVYDELCGTGTPEPVRQWIQNKPDWLDVQVIENPPIIPGLHQGEREAIALAHALNADILLIDETKNLCQNSRLRCEVMQSSEPEQGTSEFDHSEITFG